MSEIKNITAGIDWEIPLVDKSSGRSVGKNKIAELVEKAREKAPELEIGQDLDLIEVRIGMARSYRELSTNTQKAFDISGEIAAKMKAVLVPMGYREADLNPAGGHIHFGSIESFHQAATLYNRLMPYVPAFVALSASSPSLDGRFKDTRIRLDACHCSQPMSPLDPELGRESWGTDVCIKYPYKATLELRACDSQPAPRMMADIAALYVGVCAYLLKTGDKPLEPNVVEYGLNRLNACLDGLQASFNLGGTKIAAAEVVENYLIPWALEGLGAFGAPEDGFEIFKLMAKKRICPADWMRAIAGRIDDPWSFIGEMTRVYSRGGSFIEWLGSAEALKTLESRGEKALLLSSIGLNTPLESAHQSLPCPRAYTEKLLDELASEGLLVKRFGKKNEILLDRADLLERFQL